MAVEIKVISYLAGSEVARKIVRSLEVERVASVYRIAAGLPMNMKMKFEDLKEVLAVLESYGVVTSYSRFVPSPPDYALTHYALTEYGQKVLAVIYKWPR